MEQVIRLSLVPKLDADVIVVGGGPAGSALATRLARAGVGVILVDRHEFPRDKVCGDFVGPGALAELAALGVADLPEVATGHVVTAAGLFLDGHELITNRMPEVAGLPVFGRVIPRQTFDDVLFRAAQDAGATAIVGASVSNVLVGPHSVSVELGSSGQTRRLAARLLVGADGSSSTVARILRGHGPSKRDRILAVRAYYEGVQGPGGRSDLYFTAESFPGYYWLFPTSDSTANVGVGVLLDTVPPTADHLRELLLRFVDEDPALRARLQDATMVGKIIGWPLTTFNPHEPLVGDRVMLIGDAAGLINPLNGEGIQYALASAAWAADTALGGFRADDLSKTALMTYSRRVHDELRYDMSLVRLIIQLISNRTLNPLWLEALQIITARARRDPAYATVTGGVLAGLTPARDVLRPNVIIGTIEQAVETVGMQAAMHAIRGPRHVRQTGMELAQLAAQVVRDSVRRPTATARWGIGVMAASAEFGMQASRDMVRLAQERQMSRSTM